jgi:hypothetical protein
VPCEWTPTNRGRPKGTLSEGAKKIGINERRVFEVRQIRDASLYRPPNRIFWFTSKKEYLY